MDIVDNYVWERYVNACVILHSKTAIKVYIHFKYCIESIQDGG